MAICLIGMLARSGFPLASLPVTRAPRRGGTSSYRFGGRLALALRALQSLWADESGLPPVDIEERHGWLQ